MIGESVKNAFNACYRIRKNGIQGCDRRMVQIMLSNMEDPEYDAIVTDAYQIMKEFSAVSVRDDAFWESYVAAADKVCAKYQNRDFPINMMLEVSNLFERGEA